MNKWDFLIQISKTVDDQYVLKVGDAIYKAKDFEAIERQLLFCLQTIVETFEGKSPVKDGEEKLQKIQRESTAFKSGDESHTKTFEFKPLQNKL